MSRNEASRLPRATAIAAATLLLAVAGCGGDDEQADAAAEADRIQEEYVDDVRVAIVPIATQSQQLITRVSQARSIKDLSQPLSEAQEGYRTATQELQDITPPEDVAQLHEQLVKTQQQIAEATKKAEQAADGGDRDGLDEFSEAGDRYAKRSRALSEKFSDLGYAF